EPPHPQPIFIHIQSFLNYWIRVSDQTKYYASSHSSSNGPGLGSWRNSHVLLCFYSLRLLSSSPLDSRIDHTLASLVNTICFGIGSSQQRLHHSHYRIRAPLPSRGDEITTQSSIKFHFLPYCNIKLYINTYHHVLSPLDKSIQAERVPRIGKERN